MRKQPIFITLLLPAILSGCASQTGWRPTLDVPPGSAAASRIETDNKECEALARQASGGTFTETLKGAGVGALVGGASGAAIGAAIGDPGISAAIGAAGAAIAGGAYNGYMAEENFKSAFNGCMRNRGHKVVW